MLDFIPLFLIGAVAVLLIWNTWGVKSPIDLRLEGCCQTCGYDLRYSRNRCPECGSVIPIRSGDHFPLRDDWPASPIDPRPPEPNELPVLIHHTRITPQAILLRDQLIARGVACWIDQHQSPRLVGYQLEQPSDLNVMVWSADESLARDLVQRLMQPQSPARKIE